MNSRDYLDPITQAEQALAELALYLTGSSEPNEIAEMSEAENMGEHEIALLVEALCSTRQLAEALRDDPMDTIRAFEAAIMREDKHEQLTRIINTSRTRREDRQARSIRLINYHAQQITRLTESARAGK